MKMTRRDLLKFAAGSAAGILTTPVPWKSLDDTAIWTQNWPWVPRPLQGEATSKITACTLCPAGCGMKARCIGGTPVSLAGLPGHYYGKGSLCPVGLAAHHLPYHPARVRQPLKRLRKNGAVESTPVTRDEAVALLSQAIGQRQGNGLVALLDQRPGRAVSTIYRTWLGSLPGGVYLLPPPGDHETAAVAGRMTGNAWGCDLEHARTILSLGTPLLEGWASPGQSARFAAAGPGAPYLIQAETRQSHTAVAADRWLPLRPGTELALVLALCHIILREGHTAADPGPAFAALAAEHAPEKASAITGLTSAAIEEVARQLSAERPSLVVGGGDAAAGPLGEEEQTAIFILNAMLGAVGTPGGFVARTAFCDTAEERACRSCSLGELPDRSVAVLILDSAESGSVIPWELIERKLQNSGALVVSLSPFLAGLARHADLVIPAPVPLESWEDLPAPGQAPLASWAVSVPVSRPPEGSTEPVALVRLLAQESRIALSAGTMQEILQQKASRLYARKEGSVLSPGGSIPVREIESANRFFEMILSGGVWVEEAAAARSARAAAWRPLTGQQVESMRRLAPGRGSRSGGIEGSRAIIVMPYGLHGVAASGQLSPILTKIFQESGLYPMDGAAALSPSTCRQAGLADGSVALVTTLQGSLRVIVREDPAVMPGVLQIAVGPDSSALNRPLHEASGVFALCAMDECSWRVIPATIGRA